MTAAIQAGCQPVPSFVDLGFNFFFERGMLHVDTLIKVMTVLDGTFYTDLGKIQLGGVANWRLQTASICCEALHVGFPIVTHGASFVTCRGNICLGSP